LPWYEYAVGEWGVKGHLVSLEYSKVRAAPSHGEPERIHVGWDVGTGWVGVCRERGRDGAIDLGRQGHVGRLWFVRVIKKFKKAMGGKEDLE